MLKVIWSIDAFEESRSLQTHVIEAIRSLKARHRSVQIEPVYVLSPEQLNLSVEFSQPWIGRYREAAQKSLVQKLKAVKLSGILPPRVLVSIKPSLKGSVRTLTAYAKASGADLIVTASHGRKGIPRLMMGSFAESLLLQSKTPVMVVGADAKISTQPSQILFPTDFGEKSFEVFKKVVELAKVFNAKVTILHSILNPVEPIFQSGVYLMGGGWVPVPRFMELEKARQEKQAKRWIQWASTQGVQCRFVADVKASSVVNSILEYAKRQNGGMIAMAAQSGPVASTLIGSITRQVVRAGPAPVWVVRA